MIGCDNANGEHLRRGESKAAKPPSSGASAEASASTAATSSAEEAGAGAEAGGGNLVGLGMACEDGAGAGAATGVRALRATRADLGRSALARALAIWSWLEALAMSSRRVGGVMGPTPLALFGASIERAAARCGGMKPFARFGVCFFA